MYATRRESGLGLAPIVVAGLVSFGSKLAGALLGPSEGDTLEQEAGAGNIVAWWRLKAMVGAQLPAQGTINGKPFDARALTAAEREGLIAALGPDATKEDKGGGLFDSPTRNRIFRLYANGAGAQLDAKSDATLHPAAGGATLAGLDLKWILAGAVGLIVFDLFRR